MPGWTTKRVDPKVVRRDGVPCVEAFGLRFQLAVPSRQRARVLCRNPLLPYLNVAVHESEYDHYVETFDLAGVAPAALNAHDVFGLSAIRNWISDNLYDPDSHAWLFHLDDDHEGVQYTFSHVCGWVHDDPAYALEVMCYVGSLAIEAQTGLFGFAHTPRPQERQAQRPFALRVWIPGHSMGVIGKDLRFDEALAMRTDVDLTLQAVAKYKIVIQDCRWCWLHGVRIAQDVGGLAHIRNEDTVRESLAYLQEKWGASVIVPRKSQRRSGLGVSVKIPKSSVLG